MSLVERTKKANWVENVMLPLNRYGYMEECYFTYSYSPLVSDNGNVEGLFTAVTETTTRVITDRQTRCVTRLFCHRLRTGLFSFCLSLTHMAVHAERFVISRFEEKKPARSRTPCE
jgi:signal transduction histidine kinase